MILDYKKLQLALKNYYRAKGRGAWRELQVLSGINASSIARAAKGQTKPAIETWQSLHVAAPEFVPPPVILSSEIDPKYQDAKKKTAALDIQSLTDIITAIEEWLEANQEILRPDLKAGLITTLYDDFTSKKNPVEQKKVINYLKLVVNHFKLT